MTEMKDNIISNKVRRSDIFEAEREFKVIVSNALSSFRRKTNGIIKDIILQYIDDGSGRFITHHVAIIPDYKNTIIDSSPAPGSGYIPEKFYDSDSGDSDNDYEFEDVQS